MIFLKEISKIMRKLSIAFAIFAKYFEEYNIPMSKMSIPPQKIYVEITPSLLSDEDYFALLDCGFTPDDNGWVWMEPSMWIKYTNKE